MGRYYAAVKTSSVELLAGRRPEFSAEMQTGGPMLFERKEQADAYATRLPDQPEEMLFGEYGPMDTSCVCAPSVTMIYTVEADISDVQRRLYGKNVTFIGEGVRVPFADVGISHIEATVKSCETEIARVVDIDVSEYGSPDYSKLDACLHGVIMQQQRLAKGIYRETSDVLDKLTIEDRGSDTFPVSPITMGIIYAYADDSPLRTKADTPQREAFNRLGLEIADKLNFTAAIHTLESFKVFQKTFKGLSTEMPLQERIAEACKAVIDNLETSGWLADTYDVKHALPKIRESIDEIAKDAVEKFDEERPDAGDKGDGDGSGVGEGDIM